MRLTERAVVRQAEGMTDFDALAATWDDDPRRADRARRAADAIDEAAAVGVPPELIDQDF